MDDLKERLRKYAPHATRPGLARYMDEAAARIEALEAKVKEAGERLHRYFYAMDEGLDEYHAEKDLRATLAKLQEPSHDGK